MAHSYWSISKLYVVETDFTEVKPGLYGYKYLLVFIDTFSGCTEVFPTKHGVAVMMVKKFRKKLSQGMASLSSWYQIMDQHSSLK